MSEKNKECPRCGGPMEIRQGYLGAFWGCVKFPVCKGTITAKGTYMRGYANKKKKGGDKEE
jgi:DNA topoisomerase-3